MYRNEAFIGTPVNPGPDQFTLPDAFLTPVTSGNWVHRGVLLPRWSVTIGDISIHRPRMREKYASADLPSVTAKV